MDITTEIVSSIDELIAAVDKTSQVLKHLKTSEDQQFDMVCLENRLKSLFPVLESTEKAIRKNSILLEKSKLCKDLENSSSTLWNTIIILMKQEFSSKFIKTLCDIKLFCCMMLSLHESLKPAIESKFRVIKCLLKTFNLCIDENQLTLCKSVQEYVEKLYTSIDRDGLSGTTTDSYKAMGIDLSILDMQFSIALKDTVMAKFYENRSDLITNVSILTSVQLTNISRILYNIGLNLYQEENYTDSYYFLHRCYLLLEIIYKEKSIDNINGYDKVENSCLTLIVKCCIKKGDDESLSEAERLIGMLQRKMATSIEPFKLLINLFQVKSMGQHDHSIEEVFMKMILVATPGNDVIREILSLLNTYSNIDSISSKNCLLYIFNNKVDFNEDSEAAEMCLTSLFWMTLVQDKKSDETNKLENSETLVRIAERKFVKGISKQCSSCIITLFWSTGKKLNKEGKLNESIEWFKLCIHRFFKVNLANDDLGKIYRNIMYGYLNLNQFSNIDKLMTEMEVENKSELKNPITQYYLFLKNLNANREEDSLINLENLSSSNDKTSLNLLALCVIDSQNLKKHRIMNLSIQSLLKKSTISSNEKIENCVIIPIALRTSIYLNLKEFESAEVLEDKIRYVELLEEFYNQVLNFSEKMSKDEIEWFSNKAYWIGIECFKVETLTRKSGLFFGMSSKLSSKREDLKIWNIRALYFKCLCDTLIIKHSPVESEKDNITWFNVLNKIVFNLSSDCKNLDFEVYTQSMIIYLEALIEIKQCDKLKVFLKEKLQSLYNDKNKESFGNLVEESIRLSVTKDCIPTNEKFKILQIIMDNSLNVSGINTFSKIGWVRLTLDNLIDYEIEGTSLISYLDKLHSILRVSERKQEEEKSNFELEWLASKSWNNGVKLIINFGLIKVGKLWLEIGLKLSDMVNGELHDQFESMYPKLLESVEEENVNGATDFDIEMSS